MARVRPLGDKEYDPNSFELGILSFWDEEAIYHKIKESRKGSRKFYFLDGPPYPSSEEPHPGTSWNKILKDVVVRFYRSLGFDVNDTPGWDTHGLPIEVLTEGVIGLKRKGEIKRFGVENFIQKCREIVDHNTKGMTGSFKDLGVSLDWTEPYITHRESYVESIWWALKRIWQTQGIKKGLKVVSWCPRCETVLADYELNEYKDLADPSIYVKFRIRGKDRESLLIWTTTPWTLPGNVAVMVHPEYEYARVKVGGEILIMAKALVDKALGEVGVADYEIVETLPGSSLEGLEYEYPLADQIPALKGLRDAHRVILSSEFVTLEEGTGCVHTAPGHGEEDYEIAHLRYDLPVISPIDDQGRFTGEAGKYEGRYAKEANEMIVQDLKERGALFFEGKVVHRYPVCWRCKTPLLTRATDQWYISIEDLRERLVQECETVEWIPRWAGERRFKNWLLEARDWIISRQRFWGTPIPIWRCEECGEMEAIGSREELERNAGEEVVSLHRPWVDELTWSCECGGAMRRVPDILDVWFDSGAAFYASLNFPMEKGVLERWMPIDFVVEGLDQIPNGWFYSLLREGVLLFGEVPYRTVLIHGMMLDEKGHEMHKSLGNFVPARDIVRKHGRDSFRAFLLSKTPWSDVRFSWKEIENARRRLNVIWNVYSFACLYLSGLELDENLALQHGAELGPEDAWVLSKVTSVLQAAEALMKEKMIHEAFRILSGFVIEDLSHLYIRFVRDKLRSRASAERELRASVLYLVLRRTLTALAPFIPFISEKIYTDSMRQEGDPLSIHMLPWPQPIPGAEDKELEELMALARRVLNAINVARSAAGIKKRQPLAQAWVLTSQGAVDEAIEAFGGLLKGEGNIEEIMTTDKVEGPLERFSASEFEGGVLYLDKRIGADEMAKGLAAEVRRRIQQMRKEMRLTRGVETIDVWILADEELRVRVEPYLDSIAWDIGAENISFVKDTEEAPGDTHSKEWFIDGRRIEVWVKKAQ